MTGRKATSSMRWVRGRVRTKRTASATSSGFIIPLLTQVGVESTVLSAERAGAGPGACDADGTGGEKWSISTAFGVTTMRSGATP